MKNMELFVGFPDRNESLDKLYSRLECGDICLAAWADDELAGFSWASLSKFSYRGYDFPLENDEAYLYDAYTAPGFRGRGLARDLRYRLHLVLTKQGRNVFFSTIERFNPPALRFKEKMGAKIVDSAVLVDVFGWCCLRPTAHPEKVRARIQDVAI